VELNRFARRDALGDRTASDGPVRDGAIPGGWRTIAAGAFEMGSPPSEPCRRDDERQHGVTLTRAFEIMTTEVTQRQFQDLLGYNPSAHKSCADCPVDSVTWHQAAVYCNALSAKAGLTACYSCSGPKETPSCGEAAGSAGGQLYGCPGYRLPTEAEWERAYRAGTTTSFFGGPIANCESDSVLDPFAWYKLNSGSATREVAKKQASPEGLFDMGGNVLEWVNDWDGPYPSSPVTDPTGPASGSERGLRGGSFAFRAEEARAAARLPSAPSDHYNDFGFRVARTR
jgi:formylglycine-generating enzyme required for sulfatase activity